MRQHLARVTVVIGLLAAGVIPSAGQSSTPSDTLLIAKADESESNADLTVLISQETFTDASRIVVARDDMFADALASGLLQSDGPLMLIPTDGPVPQIMVDEISRLKPREAVVLGGPAAVDTDVDAQLAAMGLEVSRRQGPSRFETAIEIAKQDAPDANTVMLARAFGSNPDDPSQAFADSISAGGVAAREGYPVLLTDTSRLNASTRDYLEDKTEVQRVLILGGTAAVSAAVEAELISMGKDVERVAGASREDTAIELAKTGGDESAADALRVIVADSTGEDSWVAGFAMASHANVFDAPILLTLGQNVPQSTRDFLSSGIGQPSFSQTNVVLTCATFPSACEQSRQALGLPPADQPDPPPPPPPPTPFNATQVASGVTHTCGLAPNGSAWCWGSSGSPALGYEGSAPTTTPVPVQGGLTFVALTAGGSHTCGLTAEGQGWCWGSNPLGQLGDLTTASSFSPRQVGVPQPLRSLDAGLFHTCGVAVDDTAWCWGANVDGQLGVGLPDADPHSQPEMVIGQQQYATISAGGGHTCGVTVEDVALCWGGNTDGQLGNGTTEDAASPRLVGGEEGGQTSGQIRWATVSAGTTHTCGTATQGAGYCWGDNSTGGLGDGTTTSSSVPQAVTPGATYQQISAGEKHTCGLQDGVGVCWGQNVAGELGDGTTTDKGPVLVAGDLVFSSVSAGWNHTCAISLQAARCWGQNQQGQLGNGTTIDASTPVQVNDGPES